MGLTEKSLLERYEEAMGVYKDVVAPHKWIDNGNKTVSCPKCMSWFYKENAEYMRFCGHCGAAMQPLNSYWLKKGNLAEKIYWLLIEEGQHNSKFKWGETISNTPDEVRNIIQKHINELV